MYENLYLLGVNCIKYIKKLRNKGYLSSTAHLWDFSLHTSIQDLINTLIKKLHYHLWAFQNRSMSKVNPQICMEL